MNKIDLSLHDYLLINNDNDILSKKPIDWFAISINIIIFICAFISIYN